MSIFIVSQIAEYPIAPVSKRLEPFDITYEDVISKKQTKRSWHVYSKEPVGNGVYRLLVNLLQVWDGKNERIRFSRKLLVNNMGQKETGNNYKVLERDLESLLSIRIKTSILNTVDTFTLFQAIHYEGANSWIQFSDPFHKLAVNGKNQYKIAGEIAQINTLKPTALRLYCYLGKWLKHYREFKRQIDTVFSAVPIQGTQYKKRKQQLKLSLMEIERLNLIASWEIYKTLSGEILVVTRTSELKSVSTELNPEDIEKSMVLMKGFLRVNMGSERNWWKKVANTASLDLIEKAVQNASEQVQNIMAKGETVKNRKRVLSHHIKKVCEEAGVSL